MTLGDYADLARRRLPGDVWDFIEGGAGDGDGVRANLAAFADVRLRPRILTGTTGVTTTTTILGRSWAAPIGVAPMAYHTLAHPDGEVATVRASGPLGLPVVISTFAGTPFDALAAAASAPLWLQVYCFADRSVTRDLVERAERCGFEALVLTVDAPVLGRRPLDLRNDFRLPPGVTPVNLPPADFSSPAGHGRAAFDPALDWSVIGWLRSVTRLPVLLKGVLTPEDAALAVDAGIDGIVVSNHGGRQLPNAIATLDALPAVVSAVAGRCPVLLDGGVRRGADVLAALAAGADAVLVGRPVLHGLAAAGDAGVADVLTVLQTELAEAMLLTGTASVAAAGPWLLGAGGPAADRAAATLPDPAGGALRKEELHASLRDPLLDTMTFLNDVSARYPDAVSFAPGRPWEEFFEVEQVVDDLRRYLAHLRARGASPTQVRRGIYQYGATAGEIRHLIADSLRAEEGIDAAPESIVVTVGCQEAMLLVLRALFAGPDDVLLVASPCYVGVTGAASLLDIPVVPVPAGDAGLDCEALDDIVRAQRRRGRRPRACYVIPDHANPSGATMPVPARHRLLELAGRHGLLILEDSPYRLVSAGDRLPTLKALDRHRRVVHLGSYAKTIFPGARVGYVVADQSVVDGDGRTGLLAHELAKVKSMVTVNTAALSQAVVGGALLACGGRLADRNVDVTAHYASNLRCLLEQLSAAFPDRSGSGVRWNSPAGGFFLTLEVPFRADNAALARSADGYGVIWTPMSYFHPGPGGERGIRLAFSGLAQPDIAEGVHRLARFVAAETGTQ